MTKIAKSSAAPVARRGLLIGAGVAGATAVVAGKLTASAPAATEVAAAAAVQADPKSGYRVTAHVQRYYQTTKV